MKAITVILGFGVLGAFALSNSVLFSGGSVIAFDDKSQGLHIIRNGSVLVTDDTIVAVFSGEYSGTLPANTEVVDITGDIITPGFIDTHRHGWETAYKTIGSNTTLAEYMLRYSEFVADGLWNPEQIYISQLAGLYEAMNAGVTTMLDHAHNTWSNETTQAGLDATVASGARVVWCQAFHNVTKFTFEEQVAKFRSIAEGGELKGTTVSLGIAYDGFNPGSPAQTAEIIDLAQTYDVSMITTHSVQGVWGAINAPEDLHALGILNTSIPVVFAHASFLTPTGAQLLRTTNQYISITPESEMHYGHDHPRSHFIQDQASLGIDTHFTFSTDILTQARIWLQHVRLSLFRIVLDTWHVPTSNPMSVDQAFLLATRQGALALRRPDLGVIQVGAKADLVVWGGKSPGMLGWVDPVAAVILHANVGDIKHVMVNGVFQKRNGSLTVKNYAEIQSNFTKAALAIQETWRNMPYPVLQGEYLNYGSFLKRTETVDVLRGDGDGYGDFTCRLEHGRRLRQIRPIMSQMLWHYFKTIARL